MTISEILALARRNTEPEISLDQQLVSPDTTEQPRAEPQATAMPELSNNQPGPDNVDTYPESLRPLLATRAAEYGDGDRWEALLHNAWQLGRECPDQSLFWTLITFRAGGCQLVVHVDAGWAIRFDAQKAAALQDDTGLVFASKDAYRAMAARYLAPIRDRLTQLLQWSSLGVLEEQGDMSWAWVDADRRRKAAMKEAG